MVDYHLGDIFEAPIDILIHQSNCQNTMGSGIALEIKKRFPEAHEADCKTTKGDKSKLGTASYCSVDRARAGVRISHIFNLYGQFLYGRDKRYTNYEFYYRGLEFIKNKITNTNLVIGIPFGMGCNLAGADWNVCEAMIRSVFEKSPIQVLICKKD